MFATVVLNPLSYLEISGWYLLKGEARVRLMLEKEVTQHLSSQRRKQYCQPFYPEIAQDFCSQHKVFDQKSLMEIYSPQANVVCIQINFVGSKLIFLYRYNVKYSLCVQPCFIIQLNLGFLLLSSLQVYNTHYSNV